LKTKFITTFTVILFSSIFLFGWGDKGHKLIATNAMKILPVSMKFPELWKSEITEHSVDPDNRKRADKSEGPKHFIDIDYYKEYQKGKMIYAKDSLIAIYGDEVVTREGVLPWATADTYQKLVDAFKSKLKDKIILYSSDLAHYVADGHQPLHATLNYNGQFTDQKGIHARYEIEMIDHHLNELQDEQKNFVPAKINNLLPFIFDYINESNTYVELLLSADNFAKKQSKGTFDENYYRLLWFRTKYVTVNQFDLAARNLASLIYSAWVDAGKPALQDK